MSLYNMVLGTDPMAAVLLTVLRFTPDQVPRFRDCWWDGEKIVLLTRTGGGNRAEYATENGFLRQHPNYRNDVDNDYDTTFAEFYFDMPENMRWVVPRLAVQSKSMRERFEEALQKLNDPSKANDPQVRRITDQTKELLGQIAVFMQKDN